MKPLRSRSPGFRVANSVIAAPFQSRYWTTGSQLEFPGFVRLSDQYDNLRFSIGANDAASWSPDIN